MYLERRKMMQSWADYLDTLNAHPMGRKPVGMHWKTFSKLVLKHNRYVDLIVMSDAKFLGLIDK